jgi:hypothetical protein
VAVAALAVRVATEAGVGQGRVGFFAAEHSFTSGRDEPRGAGPPHLPVQDQP